MQYSARFGVKNISQGSGFMKTDEFREWGHTMVDWMADYLDDVGRYPVKSNNEPGATTAVLEKSPPRAPEPMEHIWRDFQDVILPGITHWQHPRFFAYFPANSSRPSVLAEMLTATLAAQCMSWETSPAATELETKMVEWLREMIGLPDRFVGSIQDTASTATLSAVLAARERATDGAANTEGLGGPNRRTVYCSAEAHSSVDKAVRIAGIGSDNLRKIPVTEDLAMDADLLRLEIERDIENGSVPICVVGTLGTTGASGFDSLKEVGAVCRDFGVWFHVDAAWAGSALVLEEYRWMIEGIDAVDSFVFNPHKWLFTNFDCSVLYVKNEMEYLRTFALTPEYLKTRRDDAVINYRDYGIQLGRRFRALKLWFVLRRFGVDEIKRKIGDHIEWSHRVAAEISFHKDFEVLRAPVLSLFCFRFKPEGSSEAQLDGLNERLLHAVNDSGDLYVTHTRYNGHYAIRFVVGQTETTEADVVRGWDRIREIASNLA